MRVIKPVVITAAQLIGSSVAESEHAAYAAGTSYALGARVVYLHKIWESVQTPNTGHEPGTDALYWAETGPTNRWSMFDTEISTVTSAPLSLSVTIAPGLVNSLALLEIDGAHVKVVVRDGSGGPIVYEYEQSLDGSTVYDWLQYFYEPFIAVHEVVLTNLPLYGNAHITVTITSAGTVNVGTLAAGMSTYLGDVEHGASAGIIDYSRKDTSDIGVTKFVRRKFSKRMSVRMMVDNYALNNLQRTIADLRATPCVWVGVDSTGYAPLTIFGFYRDFSIDVAYPTKSYCNLEIEGLA